MFDFENENYDEEAKGFGLNEVDEGGFFVGESFNVSPTQEEIELGILVIGHRFMPFYDYTALTEKDFSVVDTETYKNFRRKKITISQVDVMKYYSIFGPIGMHQGIEENIGYKLDIGSFFSMKDIDITLNVLNMKNFYKKNNFKLGDTIIATCSDYDLGIFTFEYFPKEERNKKLGIINKWVALFEKSILDIVDEIKACPVAVCVEQELEEVYLREWEFLLENPYISISAVLQLSKKIELNNLKGVGYLWKAGVNIEDELEFDFEDMINNSPGKMNASPLQILLDMMGFDFADEELVAYIKNEMYQNKKNPKFMNFYNLIFDSRIDKYYPDAKDEFIKELKKLWDKTKDEYNYFADARIAKIRAKAIECKLKHLKWMRDLDASNIMPNELPQSEILEMAQYTASIVNLLCQLSKSDFPDDELKELESMGDLFSVMDILINNIDSIIANR